MRGNFHPKEMADRRANLSPAVLRFFCTAVGGILNLQTFRREQDVAILLIRRYIEDVCCQIE